MTSLVKVIEDVLEAHAFNRCFGPLQICRCGWEDIHVSHDHHVASEIAQAELAWFRSLVFQVRGHYPEDIFIPPRLTLPEGTPTPDAYSAAGARIACDEMIRLLEAS